MAKKHPHVRSDEPVDHARLEELLARRRVEALTCGDSHLDPDVIVEMIRADRESH